MALTIVAGELGGRGAALATALASALSLDFFLTRPYLHLAIHDKDDVIAFVGLALCGLLAAALGSPRRERLLAGRRLGLLQAALREGASAGPVDSGLQQLVDAARGAFPLAAIVVRDAGGRLLARAGSAGDAASAPAPVENPAALAATAERWDWREAPPCRRRACACRSSRPRARSAGWTCGATGGPPGTTRDGPWPRWSERCRW